MPKVPKVLLLFDVSNEYSRELLQGITAYAHQRGPWMLHRPLACAKNAAARAAKFDNTAADAMIISDTLPIDYALISQVPTIVISFTKKPDGSFPAVITDDNSIGEIAAKDLLERRFCHFAYLGCDSLYCSSRRGQGFAQAIAQAGFKTHLYSRPANRNKEDSIPVLVDWLRSLPKPIAMFACSDDCAQLGIIASQIANIRIPDQLSILGTGNDRMVCNINTPALSSIVLNGERAGYEAGQLLDKMMAGKKTDRNIVVRPTHIVTRRSTCLLAIEDKEVAEAVRFIHQHAGQVIQVSDVVDAAALSRRGLEMRFQRVLGRSVHYEIRRARIEHIAQVLIETDQSISQIALQLGYPNVDHIARYFKREKGMNPRTFRKLYGRKQAL